MKRRKAAVHIYIYTENLIKIVIVDSGKNFEKRFCNLNV